MEALIEALLHAASLGKTLVATTSATKIDASPALLAALAVLGLANLALVVAALVSLIPRPAAGVRFHNKWIWAALIVIVNWIGPLAYLAVGRLDVPLPDDPGAGDMPAAERARRAVELLYGPPPGQR
jgi:hypothetical protein